MIENEPLPVVISGSVPNAFGTGFPILIQGKTYIVTSQHVIEEVQEGVANEETLFFINKKPAICKVRGDKGDIDLAVLAFVDETELVCFPFDFESLHIVNERVTVYGCIDMDGNKHCRQLSGVLAESMPQVGTGKYIKSWRISKTDGEILGWDSKKD